MINHGALRHREQSEAIQTKGPSCGSVWIASLSLAMTGTSHGSVAQAHCGPSRRGGPRVFARANYFLAAPSMIDCMVACALAIEPSTSLPKNTSLIICVHGPLAELIRSLNT